GCQIEYSLNQDFSDSRKEKIRKSTDLSELDKKLEAEKEYYIRVRIYAAIDNAFDIINHNNGTGIDPEMNNGEGSYGNGVWGRVDPIMRTYSFGIQLDI
ncbi:MAG: hypothetical protein IK092_00740, partial [Muribaculaceae bacterium]|nr:hypothetical protein [Muribaculaceae bacterium]